MNAPPPLAAADAPLTRIPAPRVLPQIVKLKAFSKFENTTEALAAATALVDSKLGKGARAPQPMTVEAFG